MADFIETCVEYINVDSYATFCSGERKWVNKIINLKAQHPNEVDIITPPEQNGGIILAHIPKSWLKISPPRKVNYTDEQKAEIAKRLYKAKEES